MDNGRLQAEMGIKALQIFSRILGYANSMRSRGKGRGEEEVPPQTMPTAIFFWENVKVQIVYGDDPRPGWPKAADWIAIEFKCSTRTADKARQYCHLSQDIVRQRTVIPVRQDTCGGFGDGV